MEDNEDKAEISPAIARAGDGEPSTRYGGVFMKGQSTLVQGNVTHINNYYPPNGTKPDEPERPEEAPKSKILQESLLFDRSDARFRNVMTAMDGTCQWFCKLDAFQSWLELGNFPKHDGFLLLKGKPGSGKSTIMKEAVTWVKRTIPDHVVVSYFFHARSPYELEKSSLGLFRWLTDQLLKAYPPGISEFTAVFSSKLRDEKLVEPWTLTELYNFLLQLSSMPRFPGVIVFIDALDEGNEEDVRSMIDMLLTITQQAESAGNRVKICVSSRHYPSISIDKSVAIVVEEQIQQKLDISVYVDHKLAGGVGPQMIEFRRRVCERANSIFLWVVLVVPILNKLHDQGRNLSFRNKQLDKIPRDLHDVFEELICREPDDIQETMTLFRWVLFSLEPLSTHELYAAIQVSTLAVDELHASFDEADDNILAEVMVPKALLHRSRGLVEFTDPPKSDIDTTLLDIPSFFDDTHSTVQFIHETVRDFLLGKDQFSSNSGSRAAPTLEFVAGFQAEASHLQIAIDCLRYLTAFKPNVWTPVFGTDEYQLIAYAALHWWRHIHVAGGKFNEELLSLVVELFLNDTKYLRWLQACRSYERDDFGGKNPLLDVDDTDPPLYYAAAFGFGELVRILLDRGADVDARGGRYGSALTAAVCFGHEEILRMLLDAGANPNIYTRTGVDMDITGIYHSSPLHAAVAEGASGNIVQMLLETGVDVHQPYRCLLNDALRRQNVDMDIVKLLVHAHVNFNSKAQDDDDTPKTTCITDALLTAISEKRPEENIVNMLIDAGADVNAQRGLYGNALQEVSYQGRKGIVKALINAGADVNARGGKYGTALIAAIYQRDDAMVKTLIDAGADVNTEPETREDGNALLTAVRKGSNSIVKVLLEAGADVNAQRIFHGNALQAALDDGRTSIVKILLEAGANLNADGAYYCNALCAAARKGDTSAVKILLEAGAEVNAREEYYGTALQAAAWSWQNTRTVEVLLEAGADVNAQGGECGNALQAAAFNKGNISTVEVLLEAGADVNTQGGKYGNALQAAACTQQNTRTVEVLLEAGADVNAQGGLYGNALKAALHCRSYEIAKTLLRADIDIAACGDLSELLGQTMDWLYPEIIEMVANKRAAGERSEKRRRIS